MIEGRCDTCHFWIPDEGRLVGRCELLANTEMKDEHTGTIKPPEDGLVMQVRVLSDLEGEDGVNDILTGRMFGCTLYEQYDPSKDAD